MSGSGVVIDPRGVILTNAHVAIENLFAEWPNPSLNDCVVRVGSPASPLYRVRLLYMPEKFITDILEAHNKTNEDVVVYGEHDYALLYITGPISDQTKMPSNFAYTPMSKDVVPGVGEYVYLAGYAASYLGYEAMLRHLYQVSSTSLVSNVKPIGNRTANDAILFQGNLAGQHGSSGGGAFTRDGKISGLLTFFEENKGYKTDEKVLAAISTRYILSEFSSDTGKSMEKYLEGDLQKMAKDYLENEVQKYVIMFAKMWKAKKQYIPGFDMSTI